MRTSWPAACAVVLILCACNSGCSAREQPAPSATAHAASNSTPVEPPGADDSGAAQATGARGSAPTFHQVREWVAAYRAAHPGRGGRDWDINARSPAEIAADPAAQRLLSICGPDQRPVIPLLAWEYGGASHPWIDPAASALVYCVYIPVDKPSSHWQFDEANSRIVADVYVLFPDQNPCKDKRGKDQVAACIGDASNYEILVDTASLRDGSDVGLNVSEASTELRLILTDGTKVQLAFDS